MLSRLPCGAWCTEGGTRCLSNGVAHCEQNDDDTCMEWSNPAPCPEQTPFCSHGVCADRCVDECAEGETRCSGADTLLLCGQADRDECLDWLPDVTCAEGTVCSAGRCAANCVDACTDGDVICQGASTMTCGDANFDGCTEWGPAVACSDGQVCSDGACSQQCTDECSATTCEGLSHRTCGQFDLDECLDLSAGESCVPSDSCLEGSCDSDAGCGSAPVVCDAPPESECIDSGTLRAYNTVGTCGAGVCDYEYSDLECPNCPACDACANVTCDNPPSVCFAATGTCADGSCSYGFANGNDSNSASRIPICWRTPSS